MAAGYGGSLIAIILLRRHSLLTRSWSSRHPYTLSSVQFNAALYPQNHKDCYGRGAQDSHPDFHTTPAYIKSLLNSKVSVYNPKRTTLSLWAGTHWLADAVHPFVICIWNGQVETDAFYSYVSSHTLIWF